ncbi:UV DNA damage repair endonuclease UvsE [Candidatus Fermentibacteria bacterium]|nr:UV DNA damage repair endonuclease UvsE [Candidatus Fermentibacteria bacterium]
MRIGYPCINRGIGCTGAATFRLKSYSEERLIATVKGNLACLDAVLRYNLAHDILFFRITSDLVPFASHPVCTFDWSAHFGETLARLGEFARCHRFRLTMHPDQFVLLNSPSDDVNARSIAELLYHAEVLDAMGMGPDAKIQIHIGGAYGDREGSLARFVRRCAVLDRRIRRRLVVENDDRLFTLADCVRVSEDAGIPVVLDWFHHQVNSSGESLKEALARAAVTWGPSHGPPLVDYSSQKAGARQGSHAESIDMGDFASFLAESDPHDFDLMLEIKDKEASALKAVASARGDPRFLGKGP